MSQTTRHCNERSNPCALDCHRGASHRKDTQHMCHHGAVSLSATAYRSKEAVGRWQAGCHLSVFSFLRTRGFTLVEVLVSIGIFTVLTGVVLANYRGYNTNALFANASEDIVLALRQAQVYGVGTKRVGASFEVPYGVYLNTDALNRNGFKFFADINGNHLFDINEDAGLINNATKWGNSISVTSLLCDGIACGTTYGANVTFERPNPDAFIANATSQAVSKGLLTIILTDSNTGKTSTISITSAGQISLQ